MSESPLPPISVLYLINGLGTGGAERSLADLLPALKERGVSVRVAALYARSRGVQDELATRTEIRILAANSFPGWIRALRRLLREIKPDVLNTTLFEADIVGRLAAVGTGIPVLTSLVNTTYDPIRLRVDPNLSRLRLRATQVIDGLTARRLTAHFHAITEAVKRSAIEHLNISPEAITVIGRGRDLTRLGEPSHQRRTEVRNQMGLTENDEVVLTLGRQEYQKGHRFLLDAIAELRPSRPNLKVIIAGREGNASSEIDRMVEGLDQQGVVTVVGHCQEVGDLLAAADVFCFPSVYEGLGGAVIEAMAMKVPIVASDLPALREVLGDAAILVPPESPGELASAINLLIEDRSLADDLASRAELRFSERFDLDDVADRMAALYHRVGSQKIGTT